MPDSDCPICLEPMTASEEVYALPCGDCHYNFCSNCVSEFLKSSQDDYAEASDGSRQVKVHIQCPQCRSKYPMEIADVLQLRRAHTVALSLVNPDDGTTRGDSELTATELAYRRDFRSFDVKKEVELAHVLYRKVVGDPTKDRALEEAQNVWKRLFDGVTEDMMNARTSPRNRDANYIDTTLFYGLEDCIGRDEQAFLTQLLTSGEAEKLAQAALIMNGVLKMSLSGANGTIPVAEKLSPKELQRRLEHKEKMKKQFPIPNHMPNYVTCPVFKKSQKFMQFSDFQWDGKIAAPHGKAQKLFDMVYQKFEPSKEKRNVVTIKSVKGPAGRLGLRRDDVVSHVNDQAWEGSAQELADYIEQLYDQNPQNEITMTVNSTSETARFLSFRCDLMTKSKIEMV